MSVVLEVALLQLGFNLLNLRAVPGISLLEFHFILLGDVSVLIGNGAWFVGEIFYPLLNQLEHIQMVIQPDLHLDACVNLLEDDNLLCLQALGLEDEPLQVGVDPLNFSFFMQSLH